MILQARDVRKLYGEFCALDGVSLAVAEGEFVSIIGPNGAGKSTLINLLTGVLRPSAGTVRFKDRDIAGIGPVALARLGLARSFQLVQIFPELTVLETLQAAVVSRLGRGRASSPRLAGDREVQAGALEVAELFGLADKRHALARQLPQGDKKLLDVASAFALRPEIILLDEPTSGVSTADKTAIMEILVAAAQRIGLRAIIQVEHDMDIVFGYSDRIVALHQGRVLADATPAAIQADERWSTWSSAGAAEPVTSHARRRRIDVYIQASHILRRVSLAVGAREVVCLVGRNGAGKTTTLRTIMGYRRPRAGRMRFRARRSTAADARDRRGAGSGSRRRTAASSRTSPWPRTSRSRRGRGPAVGPPPSGWPLAYGVFPVLRRYAARKGPG